MERSRTVAVFTYRVEMYIVWEKAKLLKRFEGGAVVSALSQRQMTRMEPVLFTAKWHFQNLFKPVVNDKNALKVFVKSWKRILDVGLSRSTHTDT